MKCNKAEKMVLLEDSNELVVRRAGRLSAHLDRCENCRNFQLTLAESRLAFHQADEPGVPVMQNILREARLKAPQRKQVRITGLRPAFATAASIAILLGLFFSAYNPGKVGMELDITKAQLLDPESQMVSVMYNGLSEDDLVFNFLMTYEEG